MIKCSPRKKKRYGHMLEGYNGRGSLSESHEPDHPIIASILIDLFWVPKKPNIGSRTRANSKRSTGSHWDGARLHTEGPGLPHIWGVCTNLGQWGHYEHYGFLASCDALRLHKGGREPERMISNLFHKLVLQPHLPTPHIFYSFQKLFSIFTTQLLCHTTTSVITPTTLALRVAFVDLVRLAVLTQWCCRH